MELNLSQAKEKNKKHTKSINTMASILHHQNNNSHRNQSRSNENSTTKSKGNGNVLKHRYSHPRISFSKRISEVRGNIFVQGLTQTTLSFCRETTLHGMKYIVDDIEELGSTFSKYIKTRFEWNNFFWIDEILKIDKND